MPRFSLATTAGRGARNGAALAGLYFLADLAGAFAAIHALFDPSGDAFLLLAIAAAATVGVGGAGGAGVAVLFWLAPRWARDKLDAVGTALPRAAGWALVVLLCAGVAIGGYALRVGRTIQPPDRRPAVAAQVPVLWVVIDTLRYDVALGPAGVMPNLRRFADGAVTFTDAESTAGWTIPATATLLTGLHSTTMDASAGFLPDWAPTIAQHLAAAGYETHAVVDNATIEPRNGFAAGFETWSQRSAFRSAFTFPAFRLMPQGWRDGARTHFRGAYDGAEDLTDTALAILAGDGHPPHPLFLYVHYMDPHAPYYDHPHMAPPPAGSVPIDFYANRDRLREKGAAPPSAGQVAWLRHHYENEVRSVDRQLGRLLAAWRARHGERSLVMFTVDHGEEFLDHGHLAHGLTVHREMVHVPLVLQLPGGVLPAPREIQSIDAPVAHIDVVPTVLDALGLAAATPADGPPIQGVSWLPWLRGEAPPVERPLIASHSRHNRRTYRYREGAWVYIKTMFYDASPTEQALYDLRADPGEQHNLLAEPPEFFAAMSARFETRARGLWRSHTPGNTQSNSANIETLRSLGYVD